MLGRSSPRAPPTLPNFDAWNRAIGPISLRVSTGSDMLCRWWQMGVVDGADGADEADRVPCRLRLGPEGSRIALEDIFGSGRWGPLQGGFLFGLFTFMPRLNVGITRIPKAPLV